MLFTKKDIFLYFETIWDIVIDIEYVATIGNVDTRCPRNTFSFATTNNHFYKGKTFISAHSMKYIINKKVFARKVLEF